MQRPMGVTVLAILAAIGGIFGVLAGLAMVGIGGMTGSFGTGFLSGFIAILGVVAIVQSVLLLAFAYGAWTLKPWAWTVGVAAGVVGLVGSGIFVLNGADMSGQVVGIVLYAVILFYLFTPTVKAAFGRA